MKNFNFIKAGAVALGLLLSFSFSAQAHTTVFGTVNAGTPGSVTFWMGSYHSGHMNQGSLTINGSTVAFNNTATTVNGVLPDPNLVFGTNLFWADADLNGTPGSFTSSNSSGFSPTYQGCCTSLTSWQSVTVSGLTAATNYIYTISGMTSQHWSDWNSGQSNWTGSFFVPQTSINASAPATLGLFALALVAVGFSRRKRA